MSWLLSPLTSLRNSMTESYIHPALETCRTFKNTAIVEIGTAKDRFYQRCTAVKTYVETQIVPSLPQKSGAARIARLQQRISILEDPSNQASITAATRIEIADTKTQLITDYINICGRYFKDPVSQIHIASRTFKALEQTYNSTAATPFDPALTQPSCEGMQPIFNAHRTFIALKQRSEAILKELRTIGSIIQSDPELLSSLQQEKKELQQFLKALCGKNKADCSSQLYKAWKEYQNSLKCNDEIASAALLEIYKSYDDQRKMIEARLLLINRMLQPSSDHTLHRLITQKIEAIAAPIRAQIEAERNNVGIDWKATAVYATAGLMPLIAYAIGPAATDEIW